MGVFLNHRILLLGYYRIDRGNEVPEYSNVNCVVAPDVRDHFRTPFSR